MPPHNTQRKSINKGNYMIKKNIYNSSGKIIGDIEFLQDKIIINNRKKPKLIINEKWIINNSLKKEFNEDLILYLYDNYTLCIGEIASILDVLYYKANQWIKKLDVKTSRHSGRRNSSYNREFSKKQKESISKSNENRVTYNNGLVEIHIKQSDTIPDGFIKGRLPFSNDHKDKIRQAGLEGKFCSPKERARKGWKSGKFDKVNFRRGIGGFITSKKINSRFFFRSLLELYYIINYLEYSDDVKTYIYEPFKIKCSDGSIYTPDFIINNTTVVELKSYNFIYKQGGSIQSKFEFKKEEAKKYCLENNLDYKVIFDKDIDFKYDVLIHQLRDLNYVEEFKIEFLEPERVWSKK